VGWEGGEGVGGWRVTSRRSMVPSPFWSMRRHSPLIASRESGTCWRTAFAKSW
jgi:hypothetical protein